MQQLQILKQDLLLFYTDGVSDRFDYDDYPQMRYEPASAIAQSIVEKFGKSHDDATCIALKYSK